MNAWTRRAVAASVLSFLGIVPHAIDDIEAGIADRFDLSVEATAWMFGLFAAGTIAAAVWAASGSRRGLTAVLGAGVAWAVAATADHWQAFFSAEFRDGFAPRLWVWLIVSMQALAAWFAWRGLRMRS